MKTTNLAELQASPNIFDFATSELSQDAFLCWLISWADERQRSENERLNDAARKFIYSLFKLHGKNSPEELQINVLRQYKNIDVLVLINDTYALIIEDKTNTNHHSDQLSRYKDIVSKDFTGYIQLPVYYKTGDQSHYRSVERNGYKPYLRKDILQVLADGINNGVTHQVFIDYYRFLKNLDESVEAYSYTPLKNWNDAAWRGFYMALQTALEEGDWGKVPNQSGGFWGFWWKGHFSEKIYMQLEEDTLCVKVTAEKDENKRHVRNKAIEETFSVSDEKGLKLEKPKRLGSGSTMTVAKRMDYIQIHEDGTINMEDTIFELKKY